MNSKQLTYYPKLDGLRGIACIIVMLFHSGIVKTYSKNNFIFPFKAGFLGVDLFFVLSGFLITNILLSEYFKTQKINFLVFFYKRMLRLYPPILVAVSLFIAPLFFFNVREAVSNAFFVLTYTTDFGILITRLIPYLEYPNMFLHTWTLAIEEQFYLFYPLLVYFYLSFCKKRNYNPVSIFWIFLVFFAGIIIYSSIYNIGFLQKFFIWRFLEIFFGCFLSFVFKDNFNTFFLATKVSSFTINALRNFFSNTFTLAISIVGFLLLISIDFTKMIGYIQNLLLTIISAVFVVNVINNTDKFGFKLLENRRLISIGKISYGLYLFHWPIFFVLEKQDYFNASNFYLQLLARDILGLSLSFLVAIGSYHLIEKRFLRLKNKL